MSVNDPNQPAPSKLETILQDIQIALDIAKPLVPVGIGVDIALEQAIEQLLIKAFQAYEANKGTPYDLANLPDEAPIA